MNATEQIQFISCHRVVLIDSVVVYILKPRLRRLMWCRSLFLILFLLPRVSLKTLASKVILKTLNDSLRYRRL